MNPTTTRRLAVVTLLLTACTVVLVYVVQLRRRVSRAEFYAQSGIESVFMICSAVIDELRHEPTTGVLRIGRSCIGTTYTMEEADQVSREFLVGSPPGPAIARIQARMDARILPWKTMDDVTSARLPKGLRD